MSELLESIPCLKVRADADLANCRGAPSCGRKVSCPLNVMYSPNRLLQWMH